MSGKPQPAAPGYKPSGLHPRVGRWCIAEALPLLSTGSDLSPGDGVLPYQAALCREPKPAARRRLMSTALLCSRGDAAEAFDGSALWARRSTELGPMTGVARRTRRSVARCRPAPPPAKVEGAWDVVAVPKRRRADPSDYAVSAPKRSALQPE